MITRKSLIEFVKNLPEESFTIDDISERILDFYKIETAIDSVKNGKGISHAQAKEKFVK